MTESAVVTERGIAMALRQSGSAGRHRRNSHAAGWTMPLEHTESHGAAGRTAPRHRKSPHAASTSGARHRKTAQAAGTRPAPRHRKSGNGNIQAIYPSFRVGQDNSIRLATRRIALPGALAVGLLAVGGVITGAFSTPLPGPDRADGGMASASIPPPPALTAMSAPSPTLPSRADRGLRPPVDASPPAAWPIIEQAGTVGMNGDDDARQPTRAGTTTTVSDRAPEPGIFAPTVIADPSSGHGGGGPAESSVPPDPPADGDGVPPGGFDLGVLPDHPAGGPGDHGNPNAFGREGGNTSNSGRGDRPRVNEDTGGRARFGGRGNRGEAGSGSHGGRDGQAGGGGQHRRDGSRH